MRGFDDIFYAPHSRHTEVRVEDICAVPELEIMATSEEAGVYLVASKDGRRSQELLRLAEEKPNIDGPYQMAVPTIRDSQYDAGELKVYLDGIDSHWFETWFNILQQGQYSHTATVGFETYRLRKYPPDCIALPISMSSSLGYNLKNIAQYMKAWITEATNMFNTEQRTRYDREENERRRRKEAEINRLKKEAEIRVAVKGLFD